MEREAIRVSRDFLKEIQGIDPTAIADAKISDTVIGLISSGQATSGKLFDFMQSRGVTPVQLGFYLGLSRTEAARTMNAYSQLQKSLRRAVLSGQEGAAEASAALKEADEIFRAGAKAEASNITGPQVASRLLDRMSNRFRGALVSQLATAQRNAISAVGRLGLDVMSRSLDLAIHKTFKMMGKGKEFDSPADPVASLQSLSRVFGQLIPFRQGKTRQEIDRVIEAFPEVKNKLFTSFNADIVETGHASITRAGAVVDKGILLANAFNRFQEYTIRRGVFAAELDSTLRARGTSLAKMVEVGGDIKLNEIRQATDKALDITFASSPSQFGGRTESGAS